jgi:hypothetical protein
MTNAFERVARGKQFVWGEYVIARLRHWVGPVEAGQVGHYEFEEVAFPVNQARITIHPRCPTGYNTKTGGRVCVAPSVPCYSDLTRYAQFRWKR